MKKKTMARIGRNDPCPCGSGRKYKKCCLERARIKKGDDHQAYAQKYNIRLKQGNDIEGIRKAGELTVNILRRVASVIEPGLTTDDINTLVQEMTLASGAVPAPLDYKGFPKSVCTSVNEVICHGIPGKGYCRRVTLSMWM